MQRPEQGEKQGVKALKERRVGRGDGGAKATRWMCVCCASEAGQAGRRCGTWGKEMRDVGGKVRAGICITGALWAVGGTGDMNVGVEDF